MGERLLRVVAAVIERDGRYLITQRRAGAVLPHLWEFPGGRVEEGESDERALHRELDERLGAQVHVRELISFVRYPYPSYTLDLYLYDCQLQSEIEVRAVADYRWIRSGEFDDYNFPPADEASMSKLLGVA